MRHFVLLAVLFVFSVGAIAPAAFAFECLMMNKMATMAGADMAMDSDMPCHNSQDQSSSPCDGICLCLHLSVNHAQVYQDSFVVFAPDFAAQDVFASYDDLVHSTSPSPLFKPPIMLS